MRLELGPIVPRPYFQKSEIAIDITKRVDDRGTTNDVNLTRERYKRDLPSQQPAVDGAEIYASPRNS